MSKPILLDGFCKAGGASYGYCLAGFEVVGVDIEPQPRYQFEFHQCDAIEFIYKHGHEFDVIHTSPPCQAYSKTASLSTKNHPKLIDPTRKALYETKKPYIIENVPGSPLINPIMLCGTMFSGLRVIRHRLFETNPILWWPPKKCAHIGKTAPIWWGDKVANGYRIGESELDRYQYISVCGASFTNADASQAMGIDWMTSAELAQSFPPVYTKWIGEQFMQILYGL